MCHPEELCSEGSARYCDSRSFADAQDDTVIAKCIESEGSVPVARKQILHFVRDDKEPLIKSARADSERFCLRRKFEKYGNTWCISCFSNCTDGAKDPLFSRRRFIQRFHNTVLSLCPLGDCFDLDQRVLRQAGDLNAGTRWGINGKVLRINRIERLEISHVRQKTGRFDDLVQS